MVSQTLRIHRHLETWEKFVRRHSQDVQAFTDSQHCRGLGEQALLNFANYACHDAGQKNTRTEHMVQQRQPDYDETVWMRRARIERNTHSVVTTGKNLLAFMTAKACSDRLSAPNLQALEQDAMCGTMRALRLFARLRSQGGYECWNRMALDALPAPECGQDSLSTMKQGRGKVRI